MPVFDLNPCLKGNLINYLKTAKGTDHLIQHQTLLHNVIPAGQSQRCSALMPLFFKSNFSSVPFTPWNPRMEGSSSSQYETSQDLAITVFTPPSVLYELCPPCVKVPFKCTRTTNNKVEKSPPPHDSFQSTLLMPRQGHRSKSVGHYMR